LCLLLPACGKTKKLTDGTFAKIYPEMPLKEVTQVLGKGFEVTPESRPGGFSSGAAAAGIDLQGGGGGGSDRPFLLPGINFSSSHKVMQWEEGDRIVQIIFVNDKVKVKQKNW
jgi:hypothetical protein